MIAVMTSMPTDSSTSVLYAAAVESFIAFARTLTPAQWQMPVPCLPGWDVRDVLSHVSGVSDDAFAGRLDGVASDAWTASQIERNREHSVDQLLERWTEQYIGFGEILDAIGEHRPPFDCHAHEHDVRHALGLAGNRDHGVVEAGVNIMAQGFAELPFAVTIELDDGRSFTSGGDGGDEPGVTVRGLTMFEVFRSRLGRRARSQVEAYDWSGDDAQVAATIAAWFNFGPAEQPISE
jgi:uncharacterized protein (TIGR03083 family)